MGVRGPLCILIAWLGLLLPPNFPPNEQKSAVYVPVEDSVCLPAFAFDIVGLHLRLLIRTIVSSS